MKAKTINIFVLVLTGLLAALKLCHVIDWSWIIVLLPAMFLFVMYFMLFMTIICAVLTTSFIEMIDGTKEDTGKDGNDNKDENPQVK